MRILYFLLVLCLATQATGQIKSPKEFLITNYGEHFTPHHLLVDYAYYLAENSDYMSIEEYGHTYEKRPLLIAIFSHPANRPNIEAIRKSNLGVVGFAEPTQKLDKAIIWLSFGVHGNEAAGPESSMTVMYRLANPDQVTENWLRESVILLDPAVNPDGFSRYTQWVRRVAGKEIHPHIDDIEHLEPWPGGRVNHYLFDLNRDWAWQTQIETQMRMVKYNEWMPHIHVDFHEMGHNAHYYFAPAARPYHEYITGWQREFQVDIGRNHARYFDKEGWIYFTRETFDLFYPSYGDTYPTFNGAIGMTYEKGGSGRAGRAIIMNNQDTLTLQDRIDHHVTTALSTIEATLSNKDKVLHNFTTYFEDAVKNPQGKFKSYIIKKSASSNALTELLSRNKISYAYSNSAVTATGYNYFTRQKERFEIKPGDLVIDVKQPKSTLLQVLLEPEHLLEDSLTYDITAWSLPFAYGVETYGLDNVISIATTDHAPNAREITCEGKPYAYYFAWGSKAGYQTLAYLLKNRIHVRLAIKNAKIGSKKIKRSYLIALAGDNKHLPKFDHIVKSGFAKYNAEGGCLESGFSEKGNDLGGRNFTLIGNPRILTVRGDLVSANAFGQVWHYFENEIQYPLSIVDINELNKVDLPDFDVFILPDGYYSLSENQMKTLKTWVRDGGKLIVIGSALRNLSKNNGFALSKYATEVEKQIADRVADEKELRERLESYEGQERRSMRNNIPGAIIKNKVDTSHPLGFGLGEEYYSLKTSRSHYNLLKDAWNVIYIPKEIESYGFIGADLKAKLPETVSFAAEELGQGNIIYMVDNPLYRGFWHSGLQLFANALFLVK